MVEHRIGPTPEEKDELRQLDGPQNHKRLTGRRYLVRYALVAAAVLGGCVPEVPLEEKSTPVPISTSIERPSPEPTETYEPTKTPEPIIEAFDGEHLPEWFNSEEVQESIEKQKAEIEQYVQDSDMPGAGPGEETGLSWNYYWDDESQAVEVNVAVKPGHGYPDRTEFTFTESGEPVQMSPEENEFLDFDWERYTFVRKDSETEETKFFLNNENQWEQVNNEALSTVEEILSRFESLKSMSQAEFDKKVEELCFPKEITRTGDGLEFITETSGKDGEIVTYVVNAVLLGNQRLEVTDSEHDVYIQYIALGDNPSELKLIPGILGEPDRRRGYYIAGFSSQRTYFTVKKEDVKTNEELIPEFERRVGDVVVVAFGFHEYGGYKEENFIGILSDKGSSEVSRTIGQALQGDGEIPVFEPLEGEVTLEELSEYPILVSHRMDEEVKSFLEN